MVIIYIIVINFKKIQKINKKEEKQNFQNKIYKYKK